MANYYSQFSSILPLPSQEAIQYGLALHQKIVDLRGNNSPGSDVVIDEFGEDLIQFWEFEVEEDGAGLWLHSGEGSGFQSCACFIQHLIEKFTREATFGFECAYICSSPVVDAFGGAAAFITKDGVEFMWISQWLSEMHKNHCTGKAVKP